MAVYSDSESEPAWYEAILEGRDYNNCEGGKKEEFWIVQFTGEYSNKESVYLGDIKLADNPGDSSKSKDRSECRDRNAGNRRNRSNSRDRSRRDRSRDRSRSRERSSDDHPDDLMAEVLRREREGSVAVGKNYGHRPASYKGSLSLKLDRHTIRKKSRSRSPNRGSGSSRSDRDRQQRERDSERNKSPPVSSSTQQQYDPKRAEAMRKLKERYGDASSSNY